MDKKKLKKAKDEIEKALGKEDITLLKDIKEQLKNRESIGELRFIPVTNNDIGELKKSIKENKPEDIKPLLKKIVKIIDESSKKKIVYPKYPEVKIPKDVSVKKPSWYKPFALPIDKMMDRFGGIIDDAVYKAITRVMKVDLDKYTSMANPISVRLVNRRKDGFYTASGGTFGGSATGDLIQKATSETDAIVTLTNQNVQYAYTLPDHTKSFSFHLRSGSYSLHYSLEALAGGNYRTLEAGVPYNKNNLDLSGATLYLRCPDAAGEIVEIEIWV